MNEDDTRLAAPTSTRVHRLARRRRCASAEILAVAFAAFLYKQIPGGFTHTPTHALERGQSEPPRPQRMADATAPAA